jgi:hypothetical protein
MAYRTLSWRFRYDSPSLLCRGPGKLSMDYLLWQRLRADHVIE